eukprot:jgi/Bigna1/55867/estExt_Genewise1Plus.C_730077
MDYDDGDWRGGGGGYSGGGVRGSVGLRNLGNTCFMNSTLQCMNATPVLADFFVDGDYTSEINPDAYKSHGRIAREFGKLLKEMWDRRPHTVTPSRFKSAIGDYSDRFSGYQQQDSQELLAALLEGLHEDLNRVRKKPYDPNPVIGNGEDDEEKAQLSWSKHRKREDSVIIDNIYGQIRSQVICPACNRASVKFDPCGILQLPFPNVDTKVVTLEGCLRGFTKEELLSAGNEYKCDHCGHEGRGKKKLDLWRLPNILIIQLKRFQYTRHYRSKIETYVEYPLEGLDMSPWTRCEAQKKDSTYDLFAVSCHGGGLGGGHYWAYAKNLIDKQKWYTLNDSSVSRMSPEKVRTSDAYLLFYVKRGATQKK